MNCFHIRNILLFSVSERWKCLKSLIALRSFYLFVQCSMLDSTDWLNGNEMVQETFERSETFHISRYFYWFIILPYCRSSQRLNMRKSQFSFVRSIVRLVLFAQDAADLWLLNRFGIVSFGNLVFVLRVHFLWVCLSILLVAQLLLNECIHQDDLMYATS